MQAGSLLARDLLVAAKPQSAGDKDSVDLLVYRCNWPPLQNPACTWCIALFRSASQQKLEITLQVLVGCIPETRVQSELERAINTDVRYIALFVIVRRKVFLNDNLGLCVLLDCRTCAISQQKSNYAQHSVH